MWLSFMILQGLITLLECIALMLTLMFRTMRSRDIHNLFFTVFNIQNVQKIFYTYAALLRMLKINLSLIINS